MADFGIKASKEGFDVKTASNTDLLFSSSLNTFKIKAEYSGTAAMDAPNVGDLGTTFVQIDHNLGYIPVVMLYYKEPSTGRWVQGPSVIPGANTGGPVGYYISGTYVFDDPMLDPASQMYLSFAYFRDTGHPQNINIDYRLYLLLEPLGDAWY